MNDEKSEVRLKPNSHQPNKAEMEDDMSIDVTPDELAKSVLRPVNLIREPVKKQD